MIIKQLTVGHMAVFCYLIGCEQTRAAMAVDPAGDEDRVAAEAKDLGLNIEYIFNTHGHPDHSCGNVRMKELTNGKIVMHAEDDDLFQFRPGGRKWPACGDSLHPLRRIFGSKARDRSRWEKWNFK